MPWFHFFPMFRVRLLVLLVRLPPLAFGKCFKCCLRIVFTCIWGAAERTRRLFLPRASDNRALMALACRHDIIVLGELLFLLLQEFATPRLTLAAQFCCLGPY